MILANVRVVSNEMKLSDNTAISMPMRNLLSILTAVGVGVWAYFGVIERLNNVETNYKLVSSDLEKNTDFRIKWPRGELGSLPADSEQFMLIEHMAGQIEKIQEQLEAGMHNKVNIEFLSKQVDKLLEDVEKLKDKIRQNGTH
jgi:hypothetical protein